MCKNTNRIFYIVTVLGFQGGDVYVVGSRMGKIKSDLQEYFYRKNYKILTVHFRFKTDSKFS